MNAGARWLIGYMLLALVLVALLGVAYQRIQQAHPAWDGTYQCRPGETYTIKECP